MKVAEFQSNRMHAGGAMVNRDLLPMKLERNYWINYLAVHYRIISFDWGSSTVEVVLNGELERVEVDNNTVLYLHEDQLPKAAKPQLGVFERAVNYVAVDSFYCCGAITRAADRLEVSDVPYQELFRSLWRPVGYKNNELWWPANDYKTRVAKLKTTVAIVELLNSGRLAIPQHP